MRQISTDASTKNVKDVFEPHTDFCATVTRLAQLVLYEPSTLHGRIQAAVEPFSRMSQDARGAVLEKVLASLAEGAYMPEIAEIMLDIGDVILGLYDASSKPIRRARSVIISTPCGVLGLTSRAISSLLSVICQSGVSSDRFESLCDEITMLGGDVSLAVHRGLWGH